MFVCKFLCMYVYMVDRARTIYRNYVLNNLIVFFFFFFLHRVYIESVPAHFKKISGFGLGPPNNWGLKIKGKKILWVVCLPLNRALSGLDCLFRKQMSEWLRHLPLNG
ncbi:hypothetical protein Hanom_Chr13g01189361 [Helianthus anomalus]